MMRINSLVSNEHINYTIKVEMPLLFVRICMKKPVHSYQDQYY